MRIARPPAVFGRGIRACTPVDTATARSGALIAPFGPVPVQRMALVTQAAPVVRALLRQTERVHAAESTDFRAHRTLLLAPGHRDFAMKIVGVRGIVRSQNSVPSTCISLVWQINPSAWQRAFACFLKYIFSGVGGSIGYMTGFGKGTLELYNLRPITFTPKTSSGN